MSLLRMVTCGNGIDESWVRLLTLKCDPLIYAVQAAQSYFPYAIFIGQVFHCRRANHCNLPRDGGD